MGCEGCGTVGVFVDNIVILERDEFMIKQTLTVNVIHADDGKILTDGEIYGTTIYLGKDRTTEEFHEISEEEYNEIRGDETNDNPA